MSEKVGEISSRLGGADRLRNADSFRADSQPDLKADFVPVRKDHVTATRANAKTMLAMGAIERENPTLKGVLPCDYARPSLDKVRLGGLVDIISNIGFNESAAKSKDVLGRVYEYFLGKFASAEGKGGGEFYTPQCVVELLVAMRGRSRLASMLFGEAKFAL